MVTSPSFTSRFHINTKTNVEFQVDRGEKVKGARKRKRETFLCGKRLSSECGAYEIEKLQADFTRQERKENGERERENSS